MNKSVDVLFVDPDRWKPTTRGADLYLPLGMCSEFWLYCSENYSSVLGADGYRLDAPGSKDVETLDIFDASSAFKDCVSDGTFDIDQFRRRTKKDFDDFLGEISKEGASSHLSLLVINSRGGTVELVDSKRS